MPQKLCACFQEETLMFLESVSTGVFLLIFAVMLIMGQWHDIVICIYGASALLLVLLYLDNEFNRQKYIPSIENCIDSLLIFSSILLLSCANPVRLIFFSTLLVSFSLGIWILIGLFNRYLQSRQFDASCSISGHCDGAAVAGRLVSNANGQSLTPREAEVFSWLVRGYSLPTIGRELGIAYGTVDSHVRHIYQKMGVHSREELLRSVESLSV